MHAAKLTYRYASAEPLLVCYSGENDNERFPGAALAGGRGPGVRNQSHGQDDL